jgi:hypothetical protein
MKTETGSKKPSRGKIMAIFYPDPIYSYPDPIYSNPAEPL